MTEDFPASEQPASVLIARELAASAAFLLLHGLGWRPEAGTLIGAASTPPSAAVRV